MKRLTVLLFGLLLLTGCGLRPFGGPIDFGAPTIPPTLCAEYDASNSWLLMISSNKGIPLNEVYYGLLDSTQLATVFEVVKREDLQKFMLDLADWYNKSYPISYTTLIEHLTGEAEKVKGITAILSRRLGDYKSFVIVSSYDDCLLRAGWSRAMDELFLR